MRFRADAPATPWVPLAHGAAASLMWTGRWGVEAVAKDPSGPTAVHGHLTTTLATAAARVEVSERATIALEVHLDHLNGVLILVHFRDLEPIGAIIEFVRRASREIPRVTRLAFTIRPGRSEPMLGCDNECGGHARDSQPDQLPLCLWMPDGALHANFTGVEAAQGIASLRFQLRRRDPLPVMEAPEHRVRQETMSRGESGGGRLHGCPCRDDARCTLAGSAAVARTTGQCRSGRGKPGVGREGFLVKLQKSLLCPANATAGGDWRNGGEDWKNGGC